MINNKDSQGCFTGFWVPISEPKSKFEKLYSEYDDLPHQVIMQDDDEFYTFGLTYRLSRSLILRADYEYATRDSTDITANYIENSIFFGIGFRR